MLASSQHAFHFGDLLISLGQQGGYADHGVFRLALLANGYDVGSPQQVVNAVESQLFDGDLEEIARYGNREMTFRVEVSAADGEALAQGEKALMAQLGRPNTLRWLPPVPPVAPTVFDVLTSWMQVDSDNDADLDELRCVRVYEITCRCMPFGRGETEVVTPAIASGGGSTVTPTVTVINNATSLTGWTAKVNGAPVTPTLDSGIWVGVGIGGAPKSVEITYTPSSAISLSGTPWLRVQHGLSVGALLESAHPSLRINGGAAQSPEISDGSYLYYKTSETSVSSLTLVASVRPPRGNPTGRFGALGLARQDVFPIIGTGRQLMRVLEIGGSAPTQGSASLEHATAALGAVKLYFNAEDGRGYQAPGRRNRVSGGTVTTDASTMSGARSALVSPVPETFDYPMANLQAGDYVVMVRMRATGAAGNRAITASFAPRIGSTSIVPATGISGTHSLATTWGFYSLGVTSIDPASAPNGVFRVQVTSTDVDLDEIYLFNTTTGSLVEVDCGTGTPAVGGASNRLWVDSPTVESPWLRIYVGTAADRSDARQVAMSAIGAMDTPSLPVGSINVLSVCDAPNAAMSARHYRRFHSNATAS